MRTPAPAKLSLYILKCTMLMVALMLMQSPLVRAGHWEYQFKTKGTVYQTLRFDPATNGNGTVEVRAKRDLPSGQRGRLDNGAHYLSSGNGGTFYFERYMEGPPSPHRAFIYSAGSVQTVLKWVPSSYSTAGAGSDAPPSVLYLWETSVATLAYQGPTSSYVTYANGGSGPGVDIELTASEAVLNVPDTSQVTEGRDETGRVTGRTKISTQLLKIEVPAASGEVTVQLPTRWLEAKVAATGYNKGYLKAGIEYQLSPIPFSINANVPFAFTPVSPQAPDSKIYDAYVGQNFKLTAPADPLQAFWEGVGHYWVTPENAFQEQRYTWSAGGVLAPLPPNATEQELQQRQPGPSTPRKEFHFDFGPITPESLNTFPKTTLTAVTVNGTSPPGSLRGKVKVRWHLKPATLHEVSITMQPIQLEDEPPDQDILNYAEEVEKVNKEVVRTGATHIKTALEAEMLVASWYVPDETDGVLLVGKAVKASKFCKKVLDLALPIAGNVLEAWKVKRIAQGKSVDVGIHVLVSVRNKGKRGTRATNIIYEADEAVGLKSIKEEIVGEIPSGRIDDLLAKNCFVAGTSVVMADGSTKPIEKVAMYDTVLSRNESTGETIAKRVTQTFQHDAKTLVLSLSSGEYIQATAEHPFYVEGKGFIRANQLGIGNSIVTRAGPSIQINKIERKNHLVKVYNIEVEDFHTYFIGNTNGGIWVHNRCARDVVKNGWSDAINISFSGFPQGAIQPQGTFIIRSKQATEDLRTAFDAASGTKAQFRANWEGENRDKIWNENGEWQIHHIHPLKWGGTNNLSNLQLITNRAEHDAITKWWNRKMWDIAREKAGTTP